MYIDSRTILQWINESTPLERNRQSNESFFGDFNPGEDSPMNLLNMSGSRNSISPDHQTPVKFVDNKEPDVYEVSEVCLTENSPRIEIEDDTKVSQPSIEIEQPIIQRKTTKNGTQSSVQQVSRTKNLIDIKITDWTHVVAGIDLNTNTLHMQALEREYDYNFAQLKVQPGYALLQTSHGIFICFDRTAVIFTAIGIKSHPISLYVHKCHCLVELQDKVYAISGMYTKRAERFNFSRGDWEPAGELSQIRIGAVATNHNDSIFVIGGSKSNSAERYDVGMNNWVLIELSLPTMVRNSALISHPSGGYLIVGGTIASGLHVDIDNKSVTEVEYRTEFSFAGNSVVNFQNKACVMNTNCELYTLEFMDRRSTN